MERGTSFIRVYRNVETNRVIIVAAGVSFLLAARDLSSHCRDGGHLRSVRPIRQPFSAHLDKAPRACLPGGAIEIIRDQLTRNPLLPGTGTLGFTFLGGTGRLRLWSANSGHQVDF